MSNIEGEGHSGNESDDEDVKLLNEAKKESPEEEFVRQRKIAQECCDVGRKLLGSSDYEGATK